MTDPLWIMLAGSWSLVLPRSTVKVVTGYQVISSASYWFYYLPLFVAVLAVPGVSWPTSELICSGFLHSLVTKSANVNHIS